MTQASETPDRLGLTEYFGVSYRLAGLGVWLMRAAADAHQSGQLGAAKAYLKAFQELSATFPETRFGAIHMARHLDEREQEK